MSEKHPLRFVRRLEGFKRLGIAPATFHDWANPSSPRFKPSLPRLRKMGGTSQGSASGFIEDELDVFINSLREH